jgi:hypothetical protein
VDGVIQGAGAYELVIWRECGYTDGSIMGERAFELLRGDIPNINPRILRSGDEESVARRELDRINFICMPLKRGEVGAITHVEDADGVICRS